MAPPPPTPSAPEALLASEFSLLTQSPQSGKGLSSGHAPSQQCQQAPSQTRLDPGSQGSQAT